MFLDVIIYYLSFPLIQTMFMAGMLASVACGMIGTFVVVKRIVFIGGGLAHTSFGGLGLAYYLSFDPLIGAALFAVGAAVVLGVADLRSKVRSDSAIGMLWVVGMALGILFVHLSEGRAPELMSILFGDILLVKQRDLIMMAILVVVIFAVVLFLYKDLLVLTFDEEFARLSGIRVGLLNTVLLVLTALTVVVLLKVVGVVLALAMLTIPATISGMFFDNMKAMMISSVLLGVVLTGVGLVLALVFDLPPGAPVVLLMVSVFGLVWIVKKLKAIMVQRRGGPENGAGSD